MPCNFAYMSDKVWMTMTAADFGYTDGTQTALFATDDGHGTIALDEIADEVEAVPAAPVIERVDGALFGLVDGGEPEDGALFGLVAA